MHRLNLITVLLPLNNTLKKLGLHPFTIKNSKYVITKMGILWTSFMLVLLLTISLTILMHKENIYEDSINITDYTHISIIVLTMSSSFLIKLIHQKKV